MTFLGSAFLDVCLRASTYLKRFPTSIDVSSPCLLCAPCIDTVINSVFIYSIKRKRTLGWRKLTKRRPLFNKLSTKTTMGRKHLLKWHLLDHRKILFLILKPQSVLLILNTIAILLCCANRVYLEFFLSFSFTTQISSRLRKCSYRPAILYRAWSEIKTFHCAISFFFSFIFTCVSFNIGW